MMKYLNIFWEKLSLIVGVACILTYLFEWFSYGSHDYLLLIVGIAWILDYRIDQIETKVKKLKGQLDKEQQGV